MRVVEASWGQFWGGQGEMGAPGVGSGIKNTGYVRRQAERVVGEYLEDVGPGVGRREVELGLRGMYPFGERKGVTYSTWLSVVKEMLDSRFGEKCNGYRNHKPLP